MCGIYGWSVKTKTKKLKTLSTVLSVLNDTRGGQSYGAWTPTRIMKDVGYSAEVSHQLARYREVFAHTRYATKGKICPENAHPFTIGKIVGAHNGQIYNHAEMNAKYSRAFEVDSQQIFAHLDSDASLEELEGYGTIEYHKEGVDGIYLAIISSSGVLSVAETSFGVAWSSNKDHLKQALLSICETPRFFDLKDHNVYVARGGVLYDTEKTLKLKEQKGDWRNGFGGSMYASPPEPFRRFRGKQYSTPPSPPTRRTKGKSSTAAEGVVSEGKNVIDHGVECQLCGELMWPSISRMADCCDNCLNKVVGGM